MFLLNLSIIRALADFTDAKLSGLGRACWYKTANPV